MIFFFFAGKETHLSVDIIEISGIIKIGHTKHTYRKFSLNILNTLTLKNNPNGQGLLRLLHFRHNSIMTFFNLVLCYIYRILV